MDNKDLEKRLKEMVDEEAYVACAFGYDWAMDDYYRIASRVAELAFEVERKECALIADEIRALNQGDPGGIMAAAEIARRIYLRSS
jgi:hypothetical protein